MSLERLDPATRALLSLAGAVAMGQEDALARGCDTCRDAGVAPLWVDELLLQSVLIVGWPRALTAMTVWRQRGRPLAGGAESGADYAQAPEWRSRGEAVCREVYGANYGRLRDNVRALHPDLEAWMIVEGYGKTMGRPGLDLGRRELCVAVQVAIQGAGPQLHSHLRGARHAGVAAAALAEALELVRPLLGEREAAQAAELLARVSG